MTEKRLRVVVIGGGIGGLFAANALVVRGFQVSVYEQAPILGEIGAGVFLTPNSVRQLQRVDLGQAVCPLEIRRGKPKSLAVFPTLAATSPDLSSALATLVRLISAGECSWLPAPACRDWRSPGSRSHERLRKSRGQQMPEVIGTRISSQLYRWMLGLPANTLPPLAEPVSSVSKL